MWKHKGIITLVYIAYFKSSYAIWYLCVINRLKWNELLSFMFGWSVFVKPKLKSLSNAHSFHNIIFFWSNPLSYNPSTRLLWVWPCALVWTSCGYVLDIKSEVWTLQRMTVRISFPAVHGVWTEVPRRKKRMQHLHLKRWHLQCWSGGAGMRGETGAGIAHIHLGDSRTTMRMSKPRVRQHTQITHTTRSETKAAVQNNPDNPPLISQTHVEINWWLFESTFTEVITWKQGLEIVTSVVVALNFKFRRSGTCIIYVKCGINDNVNTDCLDLRSIWLVWVELLSWVSEVQAGRLEFMWRCWCWWDQIWGLFALWVLLIGCRELLDAEWKMCVKEFQCFLNKAK